MCVLLKQVNFLTDDLFLVNGCGYKDLGLMKVIQARGG